jgi:LuxR family transcriptional regulator, maltose regulon positive regulatory protein
MIDVIPTKFDPPTWIGSQLQRAHLLELLDGVLLHRLTLVSAPAGYGKTSLLAQWRNRIAAGKAQVVWLSLDKEDGDLKRLSKCLLLAIQSEITGDFPDTLSTDLPPRAALSAIIKLLIQINTQTILILDDLHNADNRAAQEFLKSVIQMAPPHCHFLFSSRDYPHLGQTLFHAEGQLLEITLADLKFTPAEAAMLLAREGQSLDIATVDQLVRRTEGWPIALQLSSLSLQRGIEPTLLLGSFDGSGAELARYLSEHVMLALPENIQQAVMRTAIVDRLTGDLANLLCSRDDGWLLLERLEQQGVFLSSANVAKSEYRYHQLFAECMRERFERSSPAEFATLQSAAAKWFAERDMVDEAVRHAIKSGDNILLAGIVENAGGWRLIPRGMQGVVAEALAILPQSVVRAQPRLALASVYLNIKIGELGAARVVFDRLEAGVANDELPAELRTEIQVVGDTLTDYENQPVTFEDLIEREALLRRLPADDHLVLANINETLGAKYFESGWLERALQPTLIARDHYKAFGSLYSQIFTRFLEARIMRAQGRSNDALRILSDTRETIYAHFGDQSDLAANCAAFEAELLYEQDRLDEAQSLLEWALPHMEQYDGWVDVYAAAYFTLARSLAFTGSFDQAWAVIERAKRTAVRKRLRQLEMLADLCELELHLTHGATEDEISAIALRIGLDELADGATIQSPKYRQVALAASICRIRIKLIREDWQAALDELEQVTVWAGERRAGRLLIDLNILSAYANLRIGEAEASRSSFDEAVGIAMFQDIPRPFIDARVMVQPCLESALKASTQFGKYREQFLKAISRAIANSRNSITANGLLTEAEVEAIYHLSQGHSNKEIARLIGMSPDTVKYRLKSIFKKIGVSKRRDAIRVLVERGLISEKQRLV